MKKFVTAVAVVALVAFAAPVFAATNPFMDVPMNHWAYDAIGQLAAHGILSGYPDGLYKGKQPTTRYEMASALARALAVVDMTKASKQDVEMLQKLVVEFHDELEALGVRVDDIEGKVNLLDSRLGGWKLSGALRLDIGNESAHEAPVSDGYVNMTRARIHFDRWFGDPENPMHFRARLRGDGAPAHANSWKDFYVEIPFFWDTLLTVGRLAVAFDNDYYLDGKTAFANTGSFYALGSVVSDRDLDQMLIQKQFGMGKVSAYVAHPSAGVKISETNAAGQRVDILDESYNAWELFLMGQFQFNEQFGFDIGAQGFFGDNARPADGNEVVWTATTYGSSEFKDMYNIFAGIRFNFNDNVAFKGIFYHQKRDVNYWLNNGLGVPAWREWDQPQNTILGEDSGNHWRLIVDVKQEALKFTSLWLEYGQYDKGFIAPHGINGGNAVFATEYLPNSLPFDLKYWRIALGQTWNEKWATHLFYYGYKWDDVPVNVEDKMSEWGLGVQYKYNPSVSFGLNFVQADNGTDDKDNVVRFRTEVTF